MGTRSRNLLTLRTRRDHPHAYGDKVGAFDKIYLPVGSSPRVWGQEYMPHRLKSPFGIIPTRMGTSFDHAQRQLGVWDHPHAYGDKSLSGSLSYVKAGSSPRVWGQEAQPILQGKRWRIIPTRMGTSIFYPYFI